MGRQPPTSDEGFDTVVKMGFVQMGGTGDMGGAFVTSGEELDRAVEEDSTSTGCTGSSAEMGAPSTALVAENPATRCPISGAMGVLHGSSSGDHPDFFDAMAECSTTPVKRVELSCNQPLLEQNRFSPISEMVSDSLEEEMMLVNWVNPTESDRDEKERQLMEYVPLAQWDPNGGLVLMTAEVEPVDISVEEDLEPSAWVSKKVKGFGKWVGFPIDSCERQYVEFFQRLEKVWEKQAGASSLRRTDSSSTKGMRELWNLISTINYDGQAGKRTREIVKFSGLGSDSCP